MKPSIISAERKGRLPLWAVAFWLLVWEAAARWVDEPILLVSPITAMARLFQLLGELAFWRAVGFSLGRILLGFGLSLALGVLLAVLAYRFAAVRKLLAPLTAAIKAIPVASFVILALLWVSSKDLSVLISLLIGFPVVYGNTLTGLDGTDPKLIQMAKVFRVPFLRQMNGVYLYSVLPYLRSGAAIAMGLCWKSGVAAEIIGLPTGSVGERLYTAKVFLETPDMFCWTLVVVLLSVGCEKLLRLLLDVLAREAAVCWKR